MLAICFGINPVRARKSSKFPSKRGLPYVLQSGLERWYVAVSFLIGFGISLVPAGLGHFGPDPIYEACYFTESECIQPNIYASTPDLTTYSRSF